MLSKLLTSVVFLFSVAIAGPGMTQDVMYVEDITATPTSTIEALVRLSNQDEAAGYQIVATYPNSQLQLVNASTTGLDIEAAVGVPEFFFSQVEPMAAPSRDAVLVGVIFDFDPPFSGVSLAPGTDRSIVRFEFSVAGATAGSCATIDLTNGLGDPPLSNIITTTSGLSILPTLEAGEVCFVSDSDFFRGDVNDDGAFDIADPVALLASLFAGASLPSCLDSADANDDGNLDIADPVAFLAALFGASPFALPAPSSSCGDDPSADALGCISFSACP